MILLLLSLYYIILYYITVYIIFGYIILLTLLCYIPGRPLYEQATPSPSRAGSSGAPRTSCAPSPEYIYIYIYYIYIYICIDNNHNNNNNNDDNNDDTGLRPQQVGRHSTSLPALLATSAVGLLGASRLAPYAAGVRAVEALCARERLSEGPLDVRCAALSAWNEVGITVAHPLLAKAAPAAGLRVLSARCGLLALEGAFARFQAPRYGTLAVGVDAGHPRFAKVANN